jgi:replicative DNA helicase
MMLRRRVIDNTIEERILTGAIVSSQFLRGISSIVKKEYFVVPYVQTVMRWCMDYYKEYHLSPGSHIQDIYTAEKGNLKEEDSIIIRDFLKKLSTQYESEESFNSEYLLDQSVLYFKKRSLKNCAESIQALVEIGKIEEAEIEINKFHDVQKETSGFIDPLSEGIVKKFFQDEMDKSHQLFSFPGKLGGMIGPFEKNWLFAVMAPAKRGKTWWLQEIAIQALTDRRKTLFVSLEMNSHRVLKRIYKRLTAYGDDPRNYVYPCFDCKKNQEGSCSKKERVNKERLLDEEGRKPRFVPDMNYQICTACRGKKDFIPETWFTVMKRERLGQRNTLKIVKGLKEMYGDNFRFKSYPAFSANLLQIRSDIDDLEHNEGFVPSVIIIDYADILSPEDVRVTGRERLDETWKTLKNLSDSRHCLVVTASQTNRGSFDKKNVTQTDIAEDIRKIAHMDAGISLNQLPNEKRRGVMRVALIAGRDIDFNQLKTCMVLQNLELGQVLLDSEETYVPRDEEEE